MQRRKSRDVSRRKNASTESEQSLLQLGKGSPKGDCTAWQEPPYLVGQWATWTILREQPEHSAAQENCAGKREKHN